MINISLLFILQAITAFCYYDWMPFALTRWTDILLFVNYAALFLIWLSYKYDQHQGLWRTFPWMRIIFSATLVLLEIAMDAQETAIMKDTALSLANDFEVLFTGIVLGVLWQDKIIKHRAHR